MSYRSVALCEKIRRAQLADEPIDFLALFRTFFSAAGPAVTVLELDKIRVTGAVLAAINVVLREQGPAQLTRLRIRGIRCETPGVRVEQLIESQQATLRELIVTACELTPADLQPIGRALTRCPKLRLVDLSRNELRAPHFAGLVQAGLAAARHGAPLPLQELVLDFNPIQPDFTRGPTATEDSVLFVAQLLAQCPALRRLSLSGCGIRSSGLVLLVHQLPVLTALVHLELDHNAISQVGVDALVPILETNSRLETVDLTHNPGISLSAWTRLETVGVSCETGQRDSAFLESLRQAEEDRRDEAESTALLARFRSQLEDPAPALATPSPLVAQLLPPGHHPGDPRQLCPRCWWVGTAAQLAVHTCRPPDGGCATRC